MYINTVMYGVICIILVICIMQIENVYGS